MLNVPVPSYLKIRNLIKNIDELNKYIFNIKSGTGLNIKQYDRYSKVLYESDIVGSIIEKSLSHPLKNYINYY